MPILVHIADEKNSASFVKSGIRPGKYSKVVYFMPVLQNHFISHQWMRELRRSGVRVLVGVYFRLPSSETVWAGKYYETHKRLALGEAIRKLSLLSDPLGYEFFTERKITASEVFKIRNLPQKIGWRYKPHAHGTRPCGCPVCNPRGSYGSKRIRDTYDPAPDKVPYQEAMRRILDSDDSLVISEALWSLRGKRRKADPVFLGRLLEFDDADVLEDLAVTLAYFRHPNTRAMLVTLCEHGSAEIREAAAESAYEIYRQDAEERIGRAAEDSVVRQVLERKQRTIA